MSELLIGLTIVAAGTSLPELATSAIGAYRGQDDIAVGNVAGSNIFNILFILGFTPLLCPLDVNRDILARDIPVMAAFSLALLPIMRTGFRISRLEGAFLIAGYAAYLWLTVSWPP